MESQSRSNVKLNLGCGDDIKEGWFNVDNEKHTEGINLVYDINCSDIDSDTITYYDNTSLFNINSSTGLINDNPLQSETGTNSILITCGNTTTNISESFNYTITNSVPEVILISPENGAVDEATNVTLSISISESDNDNMNVTFYNMTSGLPICTNNTISPGVVYCYWDTKTYSTIYNWSVNVTDGLNITSSPIWNFTTSAQPNSCSWTSGAWSIIGSDLCNISSPYNLLGNFLSIVTAGTTIFTSDVVNVSGVRVTGTNLIVKGATLRVGGP